jgi:TPR repeat protein
MRVLISILTVGLIIAGVAQAQVLRGAPSNPAVDTRLLFVGADPARGVPSDFPKMLRTYAIPDLPAENAARDNALATLLRATPVSTLVSDPKAQKPRPDQFFLVSNLTLSSDSGAGRLAIGIDEFALGELAGRLAATVDAFNPSHRAVAFLSFVDQEDRFPSIVAALQATMAASGFGMIVVVVATGEGAASCLPNPTVAIHYAIIGGVPDNGQFGNGDGVSDAGEVGQFLSRTLARQSVNRQHCGPVYSLILKAEENPKAVIAVHSYASVFRDLEAMLYHENFESKFLLKSENKAKIAAYLDDCTYCPNDAALVERFNSMRAIEQIRELEEEVWSSIRGDGTRTRLAIYLEDCSICAFREEATERIHILKLQAEAREAEAQVFIRARDTLHLTVLKDYVEGCVACDYRDNAHKLIAKIEADAAHKAENAQLQEALDRSDAKAVRAYLDNCTICAARVEAETALESLSRLAEAAAPCIALAGMPQEGGPRLLTEIDTSAARDACTLALTKFPGEAGLTVRMGRVAQAEGDGSAAMEAYEYGASSGLPMGYGLAAFVRYNGIDGKSVDVEAAADLARRGADEGDWLSRELLTVIYSKGLVRDHDAAEGFQIASDLATEGNLVAQFFTGYFYLTGTGVNASETEAERWLKKAAEGGYPHAMADLAGLYENGSSAVASPERAADIYLAGLKAGDQRVKDRMTTQIRDRSKSVIQALQALLKEEGTYSGRIDGKPGKGTLTAVVKYFEDGKSE